MVNILKGKVPIKRESDLIPYWNEATYKIDPNSINESPLPGDHKHYSFVYSKNFGNWIDQIQNFEVRADDVWIVGLTKTGTTWAHNIAFKLKNGFDRENVANELQDLYFEKLTSSNEFDRDIERFKNMPSPRVFKTHLPAFLLPKGLWTVKPKIIYTIRNPKDMVVSAYHMIRNSTFKYSGTLIEYAEYFLNDIAFGSPIFDHIRGFLQLRHLDNVLINVYEEMLDDPFQGIKRICEFLQCPRTEKELLELTESVSFGKMREIIPNFLMPDDKSRVPDPNYKFCRKGKAGTYREDMSEELIKRFDDWIAESMEGVDFHFQD